MLEVLAAAGAPPVVGMSMSPAVYGALRRELGASSTARFCWGWGFPIIVDPRMTSKSGTVFYDRKVWRKRLKEQKRWDRRRRA